MTSEHELVLVVDFGAQYAQLIARRIREARIYSEIVPHTASVDEIRARNPKAIVLSGGPQSVYTAGAPQVGQLELLTVEPTPADRRAELLAEERRLFYVACTRARRRLVVTAVAGTEGEGDQPSRFLTELGARVVPVAGRPRRPLTLAALVAELRRTCADPESPPALREEAAVRLARLADSDSEGSTP